MRWVCVSLLLLLVLGCTVRKPLTRDPVMATYRQTSQAKLIDALKSILDSAKIPLLRTDYAAGKIVSDSFEVLPEYCDCGKNFFGAEYPGTRRGQMVIEVSAQRDAAVSFRLGTLLNIKANNKQVHCTSFGILEEKIISQLDSRLGIARAHDQD